MSSPLRSIRLYPTESDFLSQYRMDNGDIFYDKDKKTLVLFDGQTKSGIPLLRADLENAETGLGVAVSENPPNNSRSGSLWFDVKSGELFIYVDDGDSEQWVQPSGPIFAVTDSIAPTYVLPVASTNVLGGVRVDGSTITINNGVISATQGSGNNGGVSLSAFSVSTQTPSINSSLTYNNTTGVFTFTPPDLSNVASVGYVDQAIAQLVGSAPETLDTLNELAQALGEDPNFATTIATVLSEKAPIKNPTFTGYVSVELGTVVVTDFTVTDITEFFENFWVLEYETTNPSLLLSGAGFSITFNFSQGAPITIISGATGSSGNIGIISWVSGNVDASRFLNDLVSIEVPSPGDLSVDGSISTPLLTTTFLNTTVANIQGGSLTVDGSVRVNGLTDLQQTREVFNLINGATGVVVHDFSSGAVWVHSNITENFVANFTNIEITASSSNKIISLALILLQGATPYIPTSVLINGDPATISWQDGVEPTGNANKRDLVSFTLLFNAPVGQWIVLGSLSTYG